MRTVYDVLDDYLLTREVSDATADYYRRMVGVLCTWAGRRVPASEFTPDLVNRLLLDKQRSGLTSWYRKSLRSAMRALLAFHEGGPLTGKLRPVRVDPLVVQTWTPEEVLRLVVACDYMRREDKRRWWQTLIAAAYYTGLSTGDLLRLRWDQVAADGTVTTVRNKTRTPVVMRVPEKWLAEMRRLPTRDDGCIWGQTMVAETFRQTFARIVKKAALRGSFKTLRKSCGTSVEEREPGRGHIALGNTRRVFELHYLERWRLLRSPPSPSALPGE